MHHSSKRGLALITVLLFTVPLVMMLTAALRLVGYGTFTSLTYQDRMEAFYAAEAGVVFALEQLEVCHIKILGRDRPRGGRSLTDFSSRAARHAAEKPVSPQPPLERPRLQNLYVTNH